MKAIIIIAASILFVIAGLSIYLTPNDLANCGGRPTGTGDCVTADAIVAVSGGDTAARTNEAVQLYHNGWAPKLIFSGAAQDKSGPSNAAVMRREALDAGVPDEDIIIEEYSETTKENAEKTQNILDQNKISSVILVTSAYHQRRAGLEFAKRTGDVDVRNHPVSRDNQWSSLWWLTPTGWYLAVGEFFKIMVFFVGGTR